MPYRPRDEGGCTTAATPERGRFRRVSKGNRSVDDRLDGEAEVVKPFAVLGE